MRLQPRHFLEWEISLILDPYDYDTMIGNRIIKLLSHKLFSIQKASTLLAIVSSVFVAMRLQPRHFLEWEITFILDPYDYDTMIGNRIQKLL